MALKDTWVDKVDDVDEVLAKDINDIAEAVIQNEEDIKKQGEEKQDKLTDGQLANIDAVPNKVDKMDAFCLVSPLSNKDEKKLYFLDTAMGSTSTMNIPIKISDLTDDVGLADLQEDVYVIKNQLTGVEEMLGGI